MTEIIGFLKDSNLLTPSILAIFMAAIFYQQNKSIVQPTGRVEGHFGEYHGGQPDPRHDGRGPEPDRRVRHEGRDEPPGELSGAVGVSGP